ncbi:hypothetical protein F5Y18DRAFT_125386 [Xylariaceae sp. FL1019]|nr:hypothetical protein F5Y18DRAFT_125386 [Xylariaceae sp. FL1019]
MLISRRKNHYEYRFKKWDIKKNHTKEFWRALEHHVRKGDGRQAEISEYGLAFSPSQAQRAMQRYGRDIPTASEFGRRRPSPSIPEGAVIRVVTPDSLAGVFDWPQALPWFNFSNRVLPALRDTPALLKGFFAECKSGDWFPYKNGDSSTSIKSTSRNPQVLHQVLVDLSKDIPQSPIDVDSGSTAITLSGWSSSLAAKLLRVVFFRLSNNMDKFFNDIELRAHDKFVLYLVNAVSRSNPELLSTILAAPDDCPTSSAIKDAVYGCAIRQKNYQLVIHLLRADVSPDLRIKYVRQLSYHLEREQLKIKWQENVWELCALEVAAITCDIQLGEILLHAGANPNPAAREHKQFSLISLTAFSNKPVDSVILARFFLDNGTPLKASQNICPTCRLEEDRTSPFNIALAKGHDPLVEFLLSQESSNHELRGRRCTCLWENYLSSAFSIATASHDNKIVQWLIEPVLSDPQRIPLRSIQGMIITSCLAGDTLTACKLLNLRIDINNGWPYGITPLIATAWNPDMAVAERLLQLGADVDKPKNRSEDGDTATLAPIHIAAFHGNVELLRKLLRNGADCNAHADRQLILSTLPRSGADKLFDIHIDLRIITPLLCALVQKEIETAMFLTPLSNLIGGELVEAVCLNNKSLISDLMSRGASIFDTDANGKTVLDAAAESGDLDMILLYFSSGGEYISAALFLASESAVQSHNYSTVRLLVAKRPLKVIDQNEASAIVLSLMEHEWSLFHLLSSDPFLPSSSNSFCSEPLDYSNEKRYEYTKADLYRQQNKFMGSAPCISPLTAAVWSGNDSAVHLLIRRGYVLQTGDIPRLMRCSNARPHILDEARKVLWSAFREKSLCLASRQLLVFLRVGCCVPCVRASISLVPSLNFKVALDDMPTNIIQKIDFWFGKRPSPLIIAAAKGDVDMVHILIKYGAEVDRDILINAADNNKLDVLELLLSRARATKNPILYRKMGGRALQYASRRGHLSVARALIKQGADVNALPPEFGGRTALEGAAEHGRLDMAELLLNSGAEVNGMMRIYYIRAVAFAQAVGNNAIAKYLKRRGSWEDNDQTLLDSIPDVVQHYDIVYLPEKHAANAWAFYAVRQGLPGSELEIDYWDINGITGFNVSEVEACGNPPSTPSSGCSDESDDSSSSGEESFEKESEHTRNHTQSAITKENSLLDEERSTGQPSHHATEEYNVPPEDGNLSTLPASLGAQVSAPETTRSDHPAIGSGTVDNHSDSQPGSISWRQSLPMRIPDGEGDHGPRISLSEEATQIADEPCENCISMGWNDPFFGAEEIRDVNDI